MAEIWEGLKKLNPDATTQRLEAQPIARTPMPQWIDKDFLDWLRRLLNVPDIQWRTFHSTFKGWHYIRFAKPYPEPPAVVAVCSGFSYDLPWIPSLPDLKLPRISLPEWRRPDYTEVFRGRFEGWFRQVMGDWGILNWLRDALAKYFMGPIGWVVGSAVNFFWDLSVKPHADSWNSAVKDFTDSTNMLLEDFEDRWNTEIVDRFNSTIRDVQERMLGLVRGLGVTPLAVRNVTRESCEVYCPEDTYIYLIAAGKLV